jgi:hypothetical protein
VFTKLSFTGAATAETPNAILLAVTVNASYKNLNTWNCTSPPYVGIADHFTVMIKSLLSTILISLVPWMLSNPVVK